MTDIYKAIEEYNDLRDAGKNVEYHFGKDVTIGLENGEQTRYETVGDALQGIGMTLTGIAGGAGSATLGLPTDIAGLFVGIKDAVTAEEGKKIDAFVNGFTEFSKANLGSEYYRGIFDNFVDSFDVDPKLKEDAKSGFGAGEFGGVGGIATGGAKVGVKGVKKGLQKIGEKAQQELDLDTGGATLSSMGGGELNTMINKGLSKLSPKPKFAPEGTRANKLPHQLLVENTKDQNVLYPVTQSFIPTNKLRNFENIDKALQNNPDALKSTDNWLKFENETMGGKFLPAPPFQAIKYANDPNAMAEKLKQLTPEMKKGVDEGFGFVKQIKSLYDQPQTDPKITADLFIWGILSRGAGPVQQESAFIDIIDGASDLVKKAVDGNFTKQDQANWEKSISKLMPTGSPGKQVTQNVNATGKLLFELGKKVEGSDKTVLQTLHEMIKDKNVSAKQIRREFMNLTEGAGIDNKVVSFILLVAGRDDVLVMDRIQGRHIWDDGTFKGKNIYDGFNKEGTTVKEGLIGIFTGPRGLLLTEALEDGLRGNIEETYRILGRPQDASLGRWHWENWVIEGEQVVSHSTLEGISKQSSIGTSVVEGKPGTYSSGARYIKLDEGTFYEYPLSDGSTVFMTPARQKEFEAFIKNPKNGIVPKGFKVTEEKDIPWYEREGIDRTKLDETARKFSNANPKSNTQTSSEGVGENTNTIQRGSRTSEVGGTDEL